MQNNTFSTLFVGQNLIKLASVDSTNNFLKKMLSNSEPLPEGTVIMADEQFAGRGQQENKWEAQPGKNLTFSIFLKPQFLKADEQFLLNMAVSIAINQSLSLYLNEGLRIKWPNDIYYGGQKLGGILIENTLAGTVIKSAVIGIGINVNQPYFEQELESKAVSISQILHKNVNLMELLAEICSQTETVYLQLKAGKADAIRQKYLVNLYRIHQKSRYEKNGEVFEGVITGVNERGQLLVDVRGEERHFNFKEIKFAN